MTEEKQSPFSEGESSFEKSPSTGEPQDNPETLQTNPSGTPGTGFDPQTDPQNGRRPEKKPKKSKTAGWIVALSVLYVILFVGMLTYIGSQAWKNVASSTGSDPAETLTEDSQREELPPIAEDPSTNPDNPIVNEDYTGDMLSSRQIYQDNVGSVVFVQAGNYSGSGFVIDSENGYILTNHHVVAGREDLAVSFVNGDSYAATLVGGDETQDVAVLRIQAKDIPHVTIGNSDNIEIGDSVLVIGNPLGDLTFTATRGIVSGKDRTINTGNYDINTFQTDAAINPGNSGGPAFDATGAVIGIASAKYVESEVEGIGFCIPINEAMAIARDLVNYGYVKGRPNFGITVSTSQGWEYAIDANGRRIIVETARGAKIEKVGEGSCAEKAGLKAGDIITKIEKTTVVTAGELINAKNAYKAGETVTLEVYRDGDTMTVSVTLDEFAP